MLIAATLAGDSLLITMTLLFQHSKNRLSTDFNAPSKDQVFEFMDKAILKSGVNLIDTVS